MRYLIATDTYSELSAPTCERRRFRPTSVAVCQRLLDGRQATRLTRPTFGPRPVPDIGAPEPADRSGEVRSGCEHRHARARDAQPRSDVRGDHELRTRVEAHVARLTRVTGGPGSKAE